VIATWSVPATPARAPEIGALEPNSRTAPEIARLKELYGLRDEEGIAKILNRPVSSVRRMAEQIFQLGERLRQHLADSATARPRLAVGVTEAVPKLATFRLLEDLLRPPLSVRLECVEGAFDDLLGDLALNRLDLVIADRTAPQRANLKLHSHLLGVAPIALYGTKALQRSHGAGFPRNLDGAPLLLPTRGSPLRTSIDAWLEANEIRPEVVAEFSDSALLKTFGRAGLGLFPAPANMHADIAAQFGAAPLGTLQGVSESWYAISAPRRVQHPAVLAIQQAASERLAH